MTTPPLYHPLEPSGLSGNAGSVYSRMIHLALFGVDPDNWMGYLDDILGFASEPWEHLEHLKPLVEAHLKAGIKIQPCKTKLFQDTVEYLGHKALRE